MNKKTIYDVAKDLNLAPSTISKALNNNGSISDVTRKKVLDYVRKTGYVTATSARILKAKYSWTIGVVFSEEMNIGLEHPFFSSVFQNFKNYVEKNGYELSFIVQQLGNKKMSYLDWCHNKKVDGVLIVAGNIQDKGLIELVQSEIKCVSTDLVHEGLNSVRSDNYQGIERSMEYLIENNHKKIAIIPGPQSSFSYRERLYAYYDIMKKNNLETKDEYVSYSKGFGYTSGFNAVTEMLENKSDIPTAIIVASDDIAFGVIRGIESFGLKVPDDISVIGFDDINTSRLFTPALTTIRQNKQTIGEVAGEILIDLIKDRKNDFEHETKIDVELVIRNSVKSI